MVTTGQKAPAIALPLDNGETFRLPQDAPRVAVLVFYNQDDTDNCTRETQEFSALLPDFHAAGADVVGISPDSIDSHQAFRQKFGLTLPLAADPELTTIRAYGVWGQKKLYGREYEGLIRTTMVVDANGTIVAILPVRRINGHAAKILDLVRSLPAQ